MPAKRVNIPQKIALDELLATEVNEVAAAVNQHADALDNLAFVPMAANQYGTHPPFGTRTELEAWLLSRLSGLVTSTPDAPLVNFDTASRVLAASSPLGSAQIEYKQGTSAYQAYQAVVVDNLAHAVGEWVYRIKAQAGQAASTPTNSPKIEAKAAGVAAPVVVYTSSTRKLSASHSLGGTLLYSYRGSAFLEYLGAIQVDDVSHDAGEWQFKRAASTGYAESAAAASPDIAAAAPTATKLDPPSNLRQTASTASSATMAWDEVSNATGYRLIVNSGTTYMPGTALTYTITGLAAGSTSSVQVQALYSGSGAYAGSNYSAAVPATPAAVGGAWSISVSGDSLMTGYDQYAFPSVVARTNAILADDQFQTLDDYVPGQTKDPTNNIAVPGYWLGGSDVSIDVASESRRLAIPTDKTKWAHYNNAGVNDISNNRTLAQMQAAAQEAFQALYDKGLRKIIAQTIAGYGRTSDASFAAQEQVRQDYNAWLRTNYLSLPGVIALADVGKDRLLGVAPLPATMTTDGTHGTDAHRIRFATLFIAPAFQRVAAGETGFIVSPEPIATTAPVISNFVSTTWSSSPPILEAGSNGGTWGGFTATTTNPTPATFNRIKVYFYRNGNASGVDVQVMDNIDLPTVVGHYECRASAGTEYDSLECPVETSNHPNGWRLTRNGGTGDNHYLVKVETWLVS